MNIGPEKEEKNQEKTFFENKKKKMAENVDNSRISPRKKNILGKTFETLISVEQYEKNIMPEQLNILKRGENLLQKLLEYEKELYDEELFELGKNRRKRLHSDRTGGFLPKHGRENWWPPRFNVRSWLCH